MGEEVAPLQTARGGEICSEKASRTGPWITSGGLRSSAMAAPCSRLIVPTTLRFSPTSSAPPPPPRADAAPRSRGGDFLSGSFILYKADCHGENVAQCSSLQSLQRMFLPLPWLYVHFAMYVYRILSNEVTLYALCTRRRLYVSSVEAVYEG